jgi:hypothetical protein
MTRPRIAITYHEITPGEEGEDHEEDSGWEDQDGVEMGDDDESAVEAAVKFLRDNGVTEASSSHFHRGIWYSDEYEIRDYGTGTERQCSYHLKDFSEREEQQIFEKMHWGRRLPPPSKPTKTEQERLIDFFFPKRPGSHLMSLRSWKR